MKDTFIPTAYVERLLSQARQNGCDINALLKNVGLDRQILARRKDLPAKKYGELYRLVMLETQNEWFGMFAGGKVPLGAFRMMVLSLLQCSTLQQAIFRAGEFAEICRGMYVRFMLDKSNAKATLTMSPIRAISQKEFDGLVESADSDAIVTSMLTWHRLAEWLTDHEIPIEQLGVTFAEDELETPLAFGNLKLIKFGQKSNYLAFPESALEYPILQNQDSLVHFLSSAPYHLVTQDPAHISPAEKVRSIIQRDVGDSMPTADEVASDLNVSVTTLRRQLQKENTSFQKLKDACRMEAAFQYLNCVDLSNADIADRLGFDEPSAFFRSFKKWTGMTPGEYRATHQ